jgi:hypothetical protein
VIDEEDEVDEDEDVEVGILAASPVGALMLSSHTWLL